jgi:23S rRNA (uracil1939-C5)-methyltransferase
VEPRCPDFGRCGGCAIQHLDYASQLRSKRAQVEDCLARLGGIVVRVPEVIASPSPFEYRNKMEYSFGTRWLTEAEMENAEESPDRLGLGLHLRGRFDRVLEIRRCHLMGPAGSTILGIVRETARRSGLPAYSTRTHTGFWRFLVVREGMHTGERMVLLITHEDPPGSTARRAVLEVAARLRTLGPPVTSLLHGVTTSRAQVAVPQRVRVLAGEPLIREKLLGLTFEIGPSSFFQTNTGGAERLFREVLERGGFRPDETAWDLYCGAGGLTLPLATRVKRVVGAEVVEEAVAAARGNARANGIDNVEFVAGDIRELLRHGRLPGAPPAVVVVDPPRAGLHADVVASLVEAGPPRLVYVSCNPATLARDLARFGEGGYRTEVVQPVDLFPHTPHVECVTVLSLAARSSTARARSGCRGASGTRPRR